MLPLIFKKTFYMKIVAGQEIYTFFLRLLREVLVKIHQFFLEKIPFGHHKRGLLAANDKLFSENFAVPPA